jgi:hypothetical protein
VPPHSTVFSITTITRVIGTARETEGCLLLLEPVPSRAGKARGARHEYAFRGSIVLVLVLG